MTIFSVRRGHFAAMFLLILAAGCASGPRVYTHSMPQANFGSYETFGWAEELGTDRSGYETAITQYFKSAVRREMEALGYRYAEQDPDLLVNFFANAERQTGVRTRQSPTFGAGYYGYRYGLYGAWPVYATEVDTFDYTVGTANIDLVDAERRQLIWEGRAEGRLTERVLINPQQAIDDVVDEIFQRFPMQAGG